MMLNRTYELVVVCVCVWVAGASAVEKPTSLQKTCVTSECHAEYGRKAHVHGPVGLGECTSCHEPLDPNEHTYQFLRKGNDLCEYCHLEQTTGKIVHEPLVTGECTQCHDPHSSDSEFLLVAKDTNALCANCHETTEGMAFLHGPVAAGECTICHDAHSSDHKYLLAREGAELCFSCHVVTQTELKKYDFVHEPAKNDCLGCHDPHGGNDPKLVKNAAPQLCYSCHEDIQNVAENSKYKHKVVSDPGGCLNCHTPHASTVQFLLKKDAMSLCTACHDKPIKMADDETLPSITDEIKDKKYLHGPVADNDCSGCHIAHGSEHFRLLAKEYPPQFYAPFSKENYALCFGCHPETVVLTKETSDLTDFRNGTLNLHYVHVNKPDRGRTCRSCHATHASNLPKHIRASVPYGVWDLPINFEKTPTGGKCAPGCHLPYTYDRQSPVQYPKE
ncbi:MAG: cytochrome c3 family protein [Sedimentisphaerales bacterium]|jgi:predicted CXXCH cytochrome family protein